MVIIAPDEDGSVTLLLTRYLTALDSLIDFARLESSLLEQNPGPLPLTFVRAQEAVAEDYARLGACVLPHLARLQADGTLDADALESRVRTLVSLMKDVQRTLAARKRETLERVNRVMTALAQSESPAPSPVPEAANDTLPPSAAPARRSHASV
ncbi:hypothetical protein [Pararhodospirillum oryzae]|uniref:Uncharacterized protein n=1 Tax=Pararhodospirillum oryzae TaxID=478448 RepID=A0A512HC78_9PROT|nr:hypothetical protein [Pararhodospirillum oryzae]GEO83065.1 hypothetical protein ROR02_31960 [Pararhodospirillum oryzae]